MNITATFIGMDGSLGYKHGQVYVLTVRGKFISRKDGTGHCPYRNLGSFLSNWDNVKVVNHQPNQQ